MTAYEKRVFKFGIVHYKVGSPYHNNMSNMNYTELAKKMSSLPAKYEGQRITHKCGTLKKKPFMDNKEQSFASPSQTANSNLTSLILKKELVINEYKSLVAFLKEEICSKHF